MRFHHQFKPTDILLQLAFAAVCGALGLAASWGILALLIGVEW